MTNTPRDPSTLEGEVLRQWYLRSPAEIEQERQAREQKKYEQFFGGLRTARGPTVTGVAANAAQPARPGFNIDPEFLAEREDSRLDMYTMTPGDKGFDKSGPTIGIGVDLGSKDLAYLKSLGVDPTLVNKLSPYLGRRGHDAYNFVAKNSLKLSDREAKALNDSVHDREFRTLADKFDAASKVGPFRKLPRDTQTAIGSLYLQYGTSDPAVSTPIYWRQITSGDWNGAHQNLMKFGDAYGKRREKEAERLMNDIRSGALPRPAAK